MTAAKKVAAKSKCVIFGENNKDTIQLTSAHICHCEVFSSEIIIIILKTVYFTEKFIVQEVE